MNSYPSPSTPHQAVDQPCPRQQNAWWNITETPSAIADQTAVLESPVTWKEKQARTRQKLEQSIEVLKSKDLPGQPYVIRYLEHLYRRHCKWSSIQNACVVIFDFLFFIHQTGRRHLAQITRNELGAFVEQEQDRGLKPQTVSNKVRYLYAFFKFLEPDGIIDPDAYARKIKIRLPQSLPKAIAARDVARLF
ncbi:MAG: phage integrase N-terminal SAM-like domain-containing protein, partial [Desulfobacterales bacterium]|nr:phage integrase N-terminal SAM-like domain-containing protein [Desulfobacterales bacterium]